MGNRTRRWPVEPPMRVELGEIFGLLGANGAGKTSAINVVMRAAFPTAGDALVRGHSVPTTLRADASRCRDADGHFI